MESSSTMAAEKSKPRIPATPGEDVEVIALSPASLTVANRFFCDVCGKGFQREQNLQLHRRSHNLPWELKQRTGNAATAAGAAAKRRVYVCPVPSCVHHNPSKALGDLSGIKKHFCRKHGEKKFGCHRCGKKYAVQADIRAHAKICGTKTYHCDCGAMFNKWNDFARHKEYCDLLSHAIAKTPPAAFSLQPPSSLTLSMAAASPVPSEFPASQDGKDETIPAPAAGGGGIINLNVGDSLSASSTPASQSLMTSKSSMASFSDDFFGALMEPTLPLSFLYPPHLATNASSSQYVAAAAAAASPSPALSATALLQMAAQVGSTYSSGGFLHGLGLSKMTGFNNPQNNAMISGDLPDSMVDRASPAMFFSTQQLQTLDFLGLDGGSGNGDGASAAPFFGKLGFP